MFFTALNRLVRDFEGTPNSGISVRPPSGLVFVVPGAVASSFFRASRSTIPISNLGLYEHQTPLLAHSPRVARGVPPSSDDDDGRRRRRRLGLTPREGPRTSSRSAFAAPASASASAGATGPRGARVGGSSHRTSARTSRAVVVFSSSVLSSHRRSSSLSRVFSSAAAAPCGTRTARVAHRGWLITAAVEQGRSRAPRCRVVLCCVLARARGERAPPPPPGICLIRGLLYFYVV